MPIKRLLVANRSEIAIRIFRAATELGIETVAIYAEQDSRSLHRSKADESYPLSSANGAIGAYLDIEAILRVAKAAKVDAIHPGYGFLSESPEFALACREAGIVFVGPTPETMQALGNKVTARDLAISVGVPVVPATLPLPDDRAATADAASRVGYPLMLKASWGGGGRGMRVILGPDQLDGMVAAGRREALAAFGRDEVYLEKLIMKARHIEVQILGDQHGGLVHLFDRDCSIQRRNQKLVEQAPALGLSQTTREALHAASLRIGAAVGYQSAGTVEFLVAQDTSEFYFIEVNPRLQVEHTVTEVVTGIDIVKAQLRIAEGAMIGDCAASGVPLQQEIAVSGHAIQCRITTEDPANGFVPDHGRIMTFRAASGFGIRTDGGTAYEGALVTPHYDSLLEKVTAWAPTQAEAADRMHRALNEYRIRGIATNLPFLRTVVAHPRFKENRFTTRFIDETPELLSAARGGDRATKLLGFIADVTVNGNPQVKGRPRGRTRCVPELPASATEASVSRKRQFDQLGPSGFADWMRQQRNVLITDTTMRDAQQSLLATRMRTVDLLPAAKFYGAALPELLSLECWGGATFDVTMRFLTEDPWERLHAVRESAPDMLLQMLLRGSNAVGYSNYPDNVIRFFISQAAQAGIDMFRIFDCFNWVENMRVAIDAVRDEGKFAQGAICYAGDILDPRRSKYPLGYYVDLAGELERAGCHAICIKDMGGLLKPAAAKVLVKALREAVTVPIQLHTHDTSGIAAATLLAAIDAGVDAVDAAIDAMSGTTSQPCLGSLVEALRGSEREAQLNPSAILSLSSYFEGVRGQYTAFESNLRWPTSEVYRHEMPGGQITNLQEQAASIGLGSRWGEVAGAYRAANMAFGDIIKVTPSSKVVGDMALMMVAQNLNVDDLLDENRDIAFPASVVEMIRGDLGRPPGGWPETLRNRVLRGTPEIMVRPGSLLPDADLDSARAALTAQLGRIVSDQDLASSLMYPQVFAEFASRLEKCGPVSALPTSVFFYGMVPEDEISVQLEPGKTIIIKLLAISDPADDGFVRVFCEINGQPRMLRVPDRTAVSHKPARATADDGNACHIGSPMAGLVTRVLARDGQNINAGEAVFVIEAMKMETTLRAQRSGVLRGVTVSAGDTVEARELLGQIG